MTRLLLAVLVAEPMLEVTVDPAIDDAAQVRDWIEKEGTEALRSHDVDPIANEKSWKIGVAVSGATYDYNVQLSLARDGEALASQPEAIRCECNNEQLIAKIEEGLASAVEQLNEPASSVPPAKEGDPPVEDHPKSVDPPRKGLGPMGVTGVVLMPLGAAALIAGGVLWSRGETVDGSGASQEKTDFRPSGIALVAAGGAVLVTGVALLIADRVQARRRVAVAPDASGSRFGFVVQGRF